MNIQRGPKKSAVFDYFKLNDDKTFYVCQVEKDGAQCNTKLTSNVSADAGRKSGGPTRASNLKRHLQNKHPIIYNSVVEKDQSDKNIQSSSSSSCSTSGLRTRSEQVPVTKYFQSQKVTISMTTEKFKEHIINLVVKNGVPLTLFSSPAFMGLNGEMATKLGVSLERHDIRNMIIKEAEKQKTVLKDMLAKKFFFLKMDGCTRLRTHYMAVNIQFIDNEGNVAIRTLAVKDTEAQHSGDSIRKLIENILRDFQLRKEQILAIVTDNASNMTSAVEKLNEGELGEVEDTLEDQSEESENQEESSASCEILEAAVNEYVSYLNIPHMRCAIHTLQLAIRDGLNDRHVADVIGRLRNIAMAARTPKLDAILKRRAGKGALIDQATRWGSTYIMIQRLLELKPFLIDMANPDVSMSDIQWDQADQLESLLKHLFIATKNLQAAELTPGVFSKEWNQIIFKLSQVGGIVADGIKSSMKRREKTLFDNTVLLAAIYVDPKYRITLSQEQLEKGKLSLCDIAVHMKKIKKELEEVQVQEDILEDPGFSPSNISIHSSSSNSEGEINFESYLDNVEKAKRIRLHESGNNAKTNPLAIFRKDFCDALKEIEKFDRKSKLDVKEAIPLYPKIVQEVASIVTALPPTQVSVERLFSALRIIKSHLRASLKEDITEAILFLRTNSI